jgi:hypothetical protein
MLAAIKTANREFLQESGGGYLDSLYRLEQSLEKKSMYERILAYLKKEPLQLLFILLIAQFLFVLLMEAAFPFYRQMMGDSLVPWFIRLFGGIPLTAKALSGFVI